MKTLYKILLTGAIAIAASVGIRSFDSAMRREFAKGYSLGQCLADARDEAFDATEMLANAQTLKDTAYAVKQARIAQNTLDKAGKMAERKYGLEKSLSFLYFNSDWLAANDHLFVMNDVNMTWKQADSILDN